MSNEFQPFQEMIKILRSSVKSGFQTMDAFQEQAEKAIEHAKKSSDVIKDEADTMIKKWLVDVKEAQKSYSDVVEEGLKSMENAFKKDV